MSVLIIFIKLIAVFDLLVIAVSFWLVVSSSMTCWGNCTAMTTGLVITCYWMRKTA